MDIKPVERKNGMLRIRGGFSDTNNIAPCNRVMQLDEFDDPTRMFISNNLYAIVKQYIETCYGYETRENALERSTSFYLDLQTYVFSERATASYTQYLNWENIFNRVHEVIVNACYNEVLDIIQFICQYIVEHNRKYYGIYSYMNSVFEKEYVGYRFVDERIVPITDDLEINTINEACTVPIEGCRIQIKKAIGFISDREHPDYKNCIKESISAVESICQVITGEKKATLGDALKKLEDNGVTIHPALKQSFLKLYGYSSDQGGIRHAEGMFESAVTFEEAKFMLVSCSAFINFLIAEYGKRGS